MKSRHLVFAALCALPLTVAAAHAAPRDDVRAASLRCDGIAEERTWLNCYYGAAQPVRAELGLPPAPSSQQDLVPSEQAEAPRRSGGFWSSLWPF